MAARKKAKVRVKRTKAPARKAAPRRLRAKPQKKAAAKKSAMPRRAPQKSPVIRPAAPVARTAPARPPEQVPAAERAPAANEERIGTVTHYFGHIAVAVVRLESGNLRVGDTIRVLGHTTDFRQRVASLQIEHQAVPEVAAGREFGVKVSGHAREHDVIYKVAVAK